MAAHPYKTLPPYAFWRRAVADVAADDLDPVVSVPFTLSEADEIATAGSCFAQHISRHLRAAGMRYLVTEKAHPIVTPAEAEKAGYGLFTARYGNIYTSRQLLQLIERAYGRFAPREDVWSRDDGRHVDPFRPNVDAEGYASAEECRAHRAQHMDCVRKAFERADVFVFTLGLTECWVSRADGAVYPLCPGVAGGRFDEDRHAFVNLSAAEVTTEMVAFVDALRQVNPAVRLIVTVSPVPLVATAAGRHVLVSTTYSKSVLRVACEELVRARPQVAYFPSFEIITGSYARGRYFATDLRSVTDAGVDHVMRLFMQHFAGRRTQAANRSADPAQRGDATAERHAREMERILALVCDEEALDKA